MFLFSSSVTPGIIIFEEMPFIYSTLNTALQ